MDEADDFIDYKQLSSANRKIVEKIKTVDNIRVLRGHKGKPSFIIEEGPEIISELRPTENDNYILYKKDDSDKLTPTEKFEDIELGLRRFVNSFLST